MSAPSIIGRAVDKEVLSLRSNISSENDCLPYLHPLSYYTLVWTLYNKYDGRVRIYEICDDGFWAYFAEQNTCSTKCSNVLSQRRGRAKANGREYKLRIVWGISLDSQANARGGRNELVHALASRLKEEQIAKFKLTPYDVKKLRQKERRRKAKKTM